MSRPPVRRLKSATSAAAFSAVRSPGPTLTTNRLSASTATWSQVSPLRSSAGSAGSQFASFLATTAHFSSNWASRVCGGKRHELVVGVAGVPAGPSAQAADGVAVHLAEPPGLAGAAPRGDVLQDRFGLPGWEPGVEQRRPPALGEPALTGAAAEHAAGLVGPVAAGHRQVSRAPLAVVGAFAIQAAEPREVVHGAVPERVSSREGGTSDLLKRYRRGPPNCNTVKPQGGNSLILKKF